MLTARLRERCPSANPVGRASAPGFLLNFDKLGRDGSGKATIRAAAPGDYVHGVIFHISSSDLPALDRAEWGYARLDGLPVTLDESAKTVHATTYIAPQNICRSGLAPFDWYLELIRCGQREHGFCESHLKRLSDITTVRDRDIERSLRMFGLCSMFSGR